MATGRTYTEAPGRLFAPLIWDTGWRLSLQADRSGYGCAPALRLDTLEEYHEVEALVVPPFPGPVDLSTMGVPEAVVNKFGPPTPGSPCIGRHLGRDDVRWLRAAIDLASLNPNAGIPRGVIGWADRDIWHGTDPASATDILHNGIDLSASCKGYFGQGFYAADTPALARANYADFSDTPGAVISGRIEAGSRILDLRNAEDAREWQESGMPAQTWKDGFAGIARRAGIDGVYDRSVGGVAIFNPGSVADLRLHAPAPAPESVFQP